MALPLCFLACYFSPTWCAILKHSQIGAHYLSQMRLDQCSLIDKYVDNRVEDFYRERQGCVHKAIEDNGGDMESAMESCQGNRLWDIDLANWAGRRDGEKVSQNRLLESSFKWAGFDGPEARQSLDLVKALVGDTLVSRGGVSVEYGPRQNAHTPRTYFQSIAKNTYDRLCNGIVRRIEEAGSDTSPDQLVNDAELKSLSPGFNVALIDRATLRSLSVMTPSERKEACKTLSDALSMTVFSNDINRSMDFSHHTFTNPNLPPNRKQEIDEKRRQLKDSLEVSLTLSRQRNTPLSAALSKINEKGAGISDTLVQEALSNDTDKEAEARMQATYLDCSDAILCGGK